MAFDGIFELPGILDGFVGRDAELEYLRKCVIEEKKRIGLLTGENAIGKTSLARIFCSKFFAYEQHLFLSFHFSNIDDHFAINSDIKLVVIDDIAFIFSPDAKGKLLRLIDSYPDKQFLLISAQTDGSIDRYINYKIHLLPLDSLKSINLLTKHLKQKLGENQAFEIVNLTGGNPYIINLISHYLNDHNRNLTLQELKSLINDDISVTGYKTPSGIILQENTLQYRQIVTDIRTINISLLKQIQQRPKLMFDITPRQFEEFIAELMSKKGYEVDLTKATRDGGKDLIIASNKDLGDLIFYVECKQKAQTKPVGVHLVRQLAGSIFADRVTAGILLTSSYFSPAAKDYTDQIKHQLSLVDYVRLKDWLKI